MIVGSIVIVSYGAKLWGFIPCYRTSARAVIWL